MRLFDLLLEFIPIWISKSRDLDFLQKMPAHSARQLALWYLFKRNNKYGYTPLKYTAKFKKSQLICKILQVEHVYWYEYLTLGTMSQSVYDATELDPLLCRNDKVGSVIAHMTMGTSALSRDFLDLPVVCRIMDRKWRFYRLVLTCFCIWYTFGMSLYSWGLVSEKILKGSCKFVYNNGTNISERVYADGNVYDKMLFCVSASFFFFSIYLIINIINLFRKITPESHMWFIAPFVTLENASFLTSSSSLLLVYILKDHLCSDLWVNLLALSVVFGWMLLFIVFHIGDKSSYFIYLYYSSVNENILRIDLLILCLIIATTMGTGTYFRYSDQATEEILQYSPMVGYFDYFQLAIGISDIPVLHEGIHDRWFYIPALFYSMFLIIVNVLILNLLIAMMTDRIAQISTQKDLVCKKVHACDCVALENLIPYRLINVLCPSLTNYIVRDIRVKLPDGRFVVNRVNLINARSTSEIELSKMINHM